ncbi:MAG: cyclase family protein [Streptosporangiaceae bacterium]|jgi:kynurenine formamidase
MARAAERELTAASFAALAGQLRSRVPWGPRDRRGALNYITPQRVAAAAGEVRQGRTVSMAVPVAEAASADNPEPAVHEMRTIPDGSDGAQGLAFATDRLAMNIHGDASSHIDALCHVSYDGMMYNGVRAGEAVMASGAAQLSIAAAKDGIVGRGVLLDIPRVRNVAWLQPGEHVTADDLAAAEAAEQVRLGPGDLAFVRVGHRRRRHELGPWDVAQARAGLHPLALEFLADRQVAVLGSDSNNDTAPSAVPGVDFPVHVLAIAVLGLHLLDYLQFGELGEACERAGRWSFLCVIAPLRLVGGTGCPVNPIAIL